MDNVVIFLVVVNIWELLNGSYSDMWWVPIVSN